MSDIEKILEMMGSAPDPAGEVVALNRAVVVQLLADREHKGPLDPLVTYLRGQLDLPKIELWAMHSVGPGEIYPALNRDHAEKMLAGLRKCEQSEKQRLIDSNDPSLKYWCDWVVNIIPSPYEPEEHFRELAEQSIEEAERFRAGWIAEEAKSESLSLDASRYRFLREQHWNDSEIAVVCQPKKALKLGFDCPSKERLDSFIDAARVEIKK